MFFLFRSRATTVQGVLTETPGQVSEMMVRWAEGLGRETIVRVEGVVQEPPKNQGQEEVRSATIHKFEIRIERLHVISKPSYQLPFQVDEISRPPEVQEKMNHKVGDRTRFANRVMDLRVRKVSLSLWRLALI